MLFYTWIRDWIAAGKPLDQFVRELVVGPRQHLRQSAGQFLPGQSRSAHPRRNGGPAVPRRAAAMCPLPQSSVRPLDAGRLLQLGRRLWPHRLSDPVEQAQGQARQARVQRRADRADQGRGGSARTRAPASDAQPKFLGGYSPAHAMPSDDRLPPLADLAGVARQRPVRPLAGRISSGITCWAAASSSRSTISASPIRRAIRALLDALADDFAASGFDLRHLVRTIMTSRTYQLSAEPNETNARRRRRTSARAIVRRLPAETLLDAQCQVLDVAADFNGYPEGTRAGQVRGTIRVRPATSGPASADRFLKTFGKPERLLACECERSNETTLKQAFTLIGDEGLNDLLGDDDNRLATLAQSELSAERNRRPSCTGPPSAGRRRPTNWPRPNRCCHRADRSVRRRCKTSLGRC